MVKFFAYFFLALGFYSFNVGFLKNFGLFGAMPNLLFLLVIFLALEDDGDFYLVFSFFLGLLLDFSTGVFIGSFAIAFLFLSAILRTISLQVVAFERNWKFLPLAMLAAQCGLFLWIYIFNLLAIRLGQVAPSFELKELGSRFFWESLYNLAFLYPVWKLSRFPKKIERVFSPRVR